MNDIRTLRSRLQFPHKMFQRDGKEVFDLLKTERKFIWSLLLPIEFATNRSHYSAGWVDFVPRDHPELNGFLGGVVGIHYLIDGRIDGGKLLVQQYIEQLTNNTQDINEEDILIVRICYELLWGSNRFLIPDNNIWLEWLIHLQERDKEFGHPLGELGWRMTRQGKILNGFPRWQLSDAWLNVNPDIWHGNWKKLEPLASTWFHRYHSNLSDDTITKEALGTIDKAIREIGPGHSHYYSAVETKLAIQREAHLHFEEDYWHLKQLQKSNDVAILINDSLSSAGFREGKEIKGDHAEAVSDLTYILWKQLLTERLALRYWQLNGFMSTVAYFSGAILRAIEDWWRFGDYKSNGNNYSTRKNLKGQSDTDGNNDETNKEFLSFLANCFLAAPWGHPYSPVSRKNLAIIWRNLEAHLLYHYCAEDIINWVDVCLKQAVQAPVPVLSNQCFFLLINDLLQDKNADHFAQYTHAVQSNNHAASEFQHDLYKVWADKVNSAGYKDTLMTKAFELAQLIINRPHRATSLIEALFRCAPPDMLSKLLQMATKAIPEHLELQRSLKSSMAEDLLKSVAFGVLNRKNREDVDKNLLITFLSKIESEEEFASSDEIKIILDLLKKQSIDEKDELTYVDHLLAHLRNIIDIACQTNRSKFGFGGLGPHVYRPFKSEVTEENVKNIVKEIKRLRDASELSEYEVKIAFEIISHLLQNILKIKRIPLVQAILEYGSEIHPCRSFSFSVEDQWLDCSWIAWKAIANIARIMTIEELSLSFDLLKDRIYSFKPHELQHIAPLLSSFITGLRDDSIILQTHLMVNHLLLSLRKVTQPYAVLGILVSGIRDDGRPEFVDYLLRLIHLWIEQESRELPSDRFEDFAFYLGTVVQRISDNPFLQNWGNDFLNDPRIAVRNKYKIGLQKTPHSVDS